jgi:hypothetical protein
VRAARSGVSEGHTKISRLVSVTTSSAFGGALPAERTELYPRRGSRSV